MILQLQQLDENGENIGGLYVRKDEIAAVYYNRTDKHTYIVLNSGREFRVTSSVSELLDTL